MDNKSGRFPYTYACDHLRELVGYEDGNVYNGTKLSRSDAALIRCEIARIIGMDDEKLAIMIAQEYIDKKSR